MGRGTSKISTSGGGGGLTPEQQSEIDRFNGKTGTIVVRMIERSPSGIPYDDVKRDIRTDLERSEGAGVSVDYYSLKGNIDSRGFADVEVAYDVSSSSYTGGHDLGSGRAIVRSSTTRKYKTVRAKLMDFD